jgi:hypothetical protein
LKALEVVHKAVAEKKEIMINDMQWKYVTSTCNKKEPNQYWDNCAYLMPRLFQTAVDDVF